MYITHVVLIDELVTEHARTMNLRLSQADFAD